MTHVQVRIVPDTFSWTKSGNLHGCIAIAADGIVFPSADWRDFVSVLVDSFAQAALSLIRNEVLSAEVSFMEGPFVLMVQSNSRVDWQMHFVDRTELQESTYTMKFAIRPFLVSILSALDQVELAFRAHVPERSDELIRLNSRKKELQRAIIA